MIKPIPGIPIYGDLSYRDKKCPKESLEQITFVSRLRNQYPETYGRVVVHAKNEQRLINGQFQAITKDKAMGLSVGASDIIVPGASTFVCELKRQDASLCKIHDEQIEYLLAAKNTGSFICIALGCESAWQAFNEWREINDKN